MTKTNNYNQKSELKKNMNRNQQILELTILAGELLLKNGAEIFRVEDTMEKIAAAYGAENYSVYVISNGIFATVGNGDSSFNTQIQNAPLSPVHLGRVAAVNDLSRKIVNGELSLEAATVQMKSVWEIPFTPSKIQILAAGIGSACFCYIFGGTLTDSVVSCISGLLLWMFMLKASSVKLSKMITHIIGSVLVTAFGLFIYNIGIGDRIDKIIIGSIIPLVPGVPLTTAVRDFFNGDHLSGTIHLIDALLIAACIAIGVGAVLKVAAWMPGVSVL